MEFLPDLNDEKSKMINTSRDEEIGSKKLERVTNDIKAAKITTTTSRQWAGFKNPRIVRVSRSFGGKDRHSKVCTIKGLRDRRIRLSVPTAVQLYDLQDRLGLNQPSKVVDWLLEVTKHDIDKLPPLQMPVGADFSQLIHLQSSTLEYPHHDLNTPQSTSLSPFFNINLDFLKDGGSQHQILNKGIRINDLNGDDHHHHHHHMGTGKAKYWTNSEIDPREKRKEIERDDHQHIVQNQGGSSSNGGYIAQPQNFFPLGQQFPLIPSFLNNTNLSSYNWDPSNLSLSQFGGQLGFSSQADSSSHNNAPSDAPLLSTSQLLFRPPAATTPSSFSPPYYMASSSLQSDPRQQLSHFQLMSSSSQHSPPFFGPFKANSQENNNSQPNKEN